MKLKINSVTARLYRWFYNTHNVMPTNFCPYFWKVVLMYTLFVPLSIISIPTIILEYFTKDRNEKVVDNMKERVLMSVLFYLIIFLLFTMLSVFWVPTTSGFFTGGVFLWGIIVVISIVEFVKWAKEKYTLNKKEVDPYKEKSPNLIVEFIKAKYNKYCPHIDWDEEE